MSVARILSVKGRNVVTTRPDCMMRDLIALLAEKNIGAVVILGAEGDILGIASERDVVRVLASRGASCLDDPVSHHMTQRVVVVHEQETLDAVMETMTKGRIRHLPVVADGRLVGLVSIGDVVKERIEVIDSERRALKDYIATA